MTEPFDDLMPSDVEVEHIAAMKRDLEHARSREPAGNALHTIISALLTLWPEPKPEPVPAEPDGGDNGW